MNLHFLLNGEKLAEMEADCIPLPGMSLGLSVTNENSEAWTAKPIEEAYRVTEVIPFYIKRYPTTNKIGDIIQKCTVEVHLEKLRP